MSLICGCLWRDGRPVEAEQIGRMIERLGQWGPDATGTWREGAVAFGHLALWTTPEAMIERQPWRIAEMDVSLTADARLDNRDDLLRDLGVSAQPGETITDAELIARAYVKWGTDCVGRLLGDFAFALWDGRARRLFCARDPMGMRPFFYFLDARRFLFASETRAIFTEAEVPRELDEISIAIGLTGLLPFGDRTAFKALKELEPASALCLDEQGFRVWKHWRLELEREIRLARDEDYVDAFEEILQRAIRARLRATGRIGFMLSGGLDATTGLALALHGGGIAPERASAFSWALREGDDWPVPDERPYIDAFLREHPIEHHYVIADPARVFDLPPEMRRHENGPATRVDHCQMVPTFEVARQRGVRVILNGVGGDQGASHASHDTVLAFLLRGELANLWAEASSRARSSGRNPWRILAALVRPLLAPRRLTTPFNYQWTYRRLCERAADLSAYGIPLARSLASSVGFADHMRRVARPRLPGAWHAPLRAGQIYTLTQTHTVTDQVNAWNYAPSYGVECRSPYLDRRVLEYAVAMPPRQHVFASVGRRLLRRVSMRHLPAKIAWRNNKSATMPDMARGLLAVAPAIAERVARWRGQPQVLRYLDPDQLESDLHQVTKDTTGKGADWTPVLPLCRGVLLGDYLEIR